MYIIVGTVQCTVVWFYCCVRYRNFRCFGCVALLLLVYWITKKFLFYDHPSLMMQFSGLTIRVSVIKVKSHLVRISFSRAKIVNFSKKKNSL